MSALQASSGIYHRIDWARMLEWRSEYPELASWPGSTSLKRHRTVDERSGKILTLAFMVEAHQHRRCIGARRQMSFRMRHRAEVAVIPMAHYDPIELAESSTQMVKNLTSNFGGQFMGSMIPDGAPNRTNCRYRNARQYARPFLSNIRNDLILGKVRIS